MQLESGPEADPARARMQHQRRGRTAQLCDFADRNVFIILVFAAAGLLRLGLLGLGIGSDTWYTLLGGRVVSRSWIPHGDSLTILGRGHEWVDQQWLGHLMLYGSWSSGGWPLALLILLAGYLGAFALAIVTARRLGASAESAAVVGLLGLVMALGESAFRAQTLAYPLFAVLLLLLLEDERQPSRRVLLTLPILALWANVHGSVVLGAALVCLRGLTLAWEHRSFGQRAAVLIVAPWLCTIASPYGLALPGYYLRLLHNPALDRFVSEWQPATVKNQPLFFVLLALALALCARGRRRPFARLALLVTAVGGLLAVRSVVWFALAVVAVLPAALDALWSGSTAPRKRRLNLAIAAGSVARCSLRQPRTPATTDPGSSAATRRRPATPSLRRPGPTRRRRSLRPSATPTGFSSTMTSSPAGLPTACDSNCSANVS